MSFSRIIQQLLIPSTFILVLGIIGLVFLFFTKKKKIGKILLVVGIVFYYFFSIAPVSNLILSPLEKPYSFLEIENINEANKIVVLLGGSESNILRGSEALRIYHLRNGDIKIIISGTDPLLSTSEEALGVKRFFMNRGVKENNIIIEGRSKNTWENIRNVKELVEEKPFFLVTSAYHMKRSLEEFQKLEANPIPAPTDFKIKKEKHNFFDFMPNAQNLRNSNLAFHEYFGILYYWVIGL